MSADADRKKRTQLKELPDIIYNPANKKKYLKGKFLGKGGFARCYELTDASTKEIYAGKVVSKTLLVKKHQKDKMAQEITLHRELNHPHVVGFHSYFEDDENVYILLELCRRRSLMELHKRRGSVTEPEARYFLAQIVDACIYLHHNRIIHRDLKLGNLFLNDEMEIKIGDFGLATRLEYEGERKKTLCGTPNYIAPEMLGKVGHSYGVDIWAIGCILYTLLVGKPPFETETLKETYNRIKKNAYNVPSTVSPAARHLIERLLQADPQARPTVDEIMQFEFFTHGFKPNRLPVSCLTMCPNVGSNRDKPPASPNSRRPLVPVNEVLSPRQQVRKDMLAAPARHLKPVPENEVLTAKTSTCKAGDMAARLDPPCKDKTSDLRLQNLLRQLSSLVSSRPSKRSQIQQSEAEDPSCTPVYWVSKWVDYSDKYGIAYQLCDNSIGVLYNDGTRLVLNGAGRQLQFIDRGGDEKYFTITTVPEEHEKRTKLLTFFRNYMHDHLLKAGAAMATREGDELTRLPYLRLWFRTKSAIIFYLSNGTFQINFFESHEKLILCPLMSAVTFIDSSRNFFTYRFSLLEEHGCEESLFNLLCYAKTSVERSFQPLVKYSRTASSVASQN